MRWIPHCRISSPASSGCRAIPHCGCPARTTPVLPPRSRWRRTCGSTRARPVMTWAGRSSWNGCGSGRKSTAAASWNSRRSWAFPATGTAPASPWTRAVPRPSGRPSASSMTRASSTRAAALSTGAPTVPPLSPTRRWSTWISPATCGISVIPWPTAPVIW